MYTHTVRLLVALTLAGVAACGGDEASPGPDTTPDTTSDVDGTSDGSATPDGGEGPDAGTDGGDASPDAMADGMDDTGDVNPDAGGSELCDDGQDNDGDGQVDCADGDCELDAACTVPAEVCSNEADDDADGDVDCADTDCAATPECFVAVAEDCRNAEDDDGDGDIDCADADCARSAACLDAGVEACDDAIDNDEDGDVDCDDSECVRAPQCFTPSENCSNAADDDEDGAVDCDDTDCAPFPVCRVAEACDDGVDNDGDGDADCGDADCDGDAACSAAVELCSNRVDDDGDGDIDCADAECRVALICAGSVEACGNGEDDDRDGDVDCADADCVENRACVSSFAEVCGNGEDDDGDGLTDCDDGECLDDPACVDAIENCTNDVDDDADGLTDCADPGCFGTTSCAAAVEICDDDVDNDGDGQLNCLDFDDCLGSAACPIVPTAGGGPLDVCPTEVTVEACGICFSANCCVERRNACEDLMVATFEDGVDLTVTPLLPTAYEERLTGFAPSPWSFDDFAVADTYRLPAEPMQDGTLADPAYFGGATRGILASLDRARDASVAFTTCDEYANQTYYTYELYRRAGRTRTSVEWAKWARDEANADVGGLVAAFVSGDDVRNLAGVDYANHGLPDGKNGNAFQRRLADYRGATIIESISLSGAYRNEYHALTEQTLTWISARDSAIGDRLRAGRTTSSLLPASSRNRIANDTSWTLMSTLSDTFLNDPEANVPLMTLNYMRRQRFRRAVEEEAERYNSCIALGVGPTICANSVSRLRAEIMELLNWAGENGCLAPAVTRPTPGSVSGWNPVWAWNACDFSAHDLHNGIQDIFEPLVLRERERCEELPVTMRQLQSGTEFAFEIECNPARLARFTASDLTSDFVMRLKIDLYEQELTNTAECETDAALLAFAEAQAGTARNRPALRYAAGDSQSWGRKSLIWAGYAYEVDIGLIDAEDVGRCVFSNPHATASLDIDAALFNLELPIVNFAADYSVNPRQKYVDLDVFGTELENTQLDGECGSPARHSDCSTRGAHVFTFERSPSAGDSFEQDATFVILGVPVTVSGGLAGEFGVQVVFEAEFAAGFGAGGTCAGAAGSVSASVTPYAEAAVTASAGLGFGGLSAGVRGRVTVIEVRVPATASIGASVDVGGALAEMSFQTQGDVLLESLNGYLELYAEAGPLDASIEICDWDGIDKSWNLWDVEYEASYDAWTEWFGGE